MKTAERDIQAVKNKPLYSKIYRIHQTDISVEPINVLNELLFKLLHMLPFKVFFQSLWDLIVSVPDHCLSYYFRWNVFYCFYMEFQLYTCKIGTFTARSL